MNKLLIILIFSILTTTTANAADKWTIEDKALEIVWIGLHIIDWGQTRSVAMQPNRYRENNPYIGEHPSVDTVDWYMGALTFLHPLISHYLPVKTNFLGFAIKPRAIWQNASIGITGGAVFKNFSIGLTVKF
jgi:hypothetical protein